MSSIFKDKRDILEHDQPVRLKFCREIEVKNKRKNILMFKTKFLLKMSRLKKLGEK